MTIPELLALRPDIKAWPQTLSLSWDSNPYAFGAIHCRAAGVTPSIGGLSVVAERVRGYFGSEQVYEGASETEAMAAVEAAIHAAHRAFCRCRALLDQQELRRLLMAVAPVVRLQREDPPKPDEKWDAANGCFWRPTERVDVWRKVYQVDSTGIYVSRAVEADDDDDDDDDARRTMIGIEWDEREEWVDLLGMVFTRLSTANADCSRPVGRYRAVFLTGHGQGETPCV